MKNKLMEAIRHSPEGQSHCVCGNDADLIFLGLALGGERFHIFREVQQFHTDKIKAQEKGKGKGKDSGRKNQNTGGELKKRPPPINSSRRRSGREPGGLIIVTSVHMIIWPHDHMPM